MSFVYIPHILGDICQLGGSLCALQAQDHAFSKNVHILFPNHPYMIFRAEIA